MTLSTIDARRGAKRVALGTIGWIAVLAGAKLAVGVLTGSVAVLGDGLHSALDLAIAGLTFAAIRLAAKPPDASHPYGHGRAENLAALAEAIVMSLVAAGVALEAARRLTTTSDVEAPVYAVAVTGAALVIGVWRSRVLARAATKYRSPALAADAANITADVVESAAVLIGLALIRAGVEAADAIAAFVVVAIMLAMAIRIGLAAIHVLMDRAPTDLTDRLTAAAGGVGGVIEVGDLRVRQSGADVHAEVTVSVSRTESVERSHDISEAVEAAVAHAVPGASATVHIEPSTAGEDIVRQTFAAANRLGMADQVHNVLAIRHAEGIWLMLHAKVPGATPLAEAHRVTDELERELRAEIDGLARVEIHLEPHEPSWLTGTVVTAQHADLVAEIAAIAEARPPIARCHEVALTQAVDGFHVVLHCEALASTPIAAVHDASLTVESDIHRRYREVRSVTVHFEPQQEA
jgi:cation diffusion facilitator family transporter